MTDGTPNAGEQRPGSLDDFIDAYAEFVQAADDSEDAVDEANDYLFDCYAASHLDEWEVPDAPGGLEPLDELPIGYDGELDPDTVGKRFDEVVDVLHSRSSTGSFYTPEYIVTFMVEQTVRPRVKDWLDDFDIDVSELEDEPTPEELAGACTEIEAKEVLADLQDMSILDPSCGSGQFLVGAVDEMADITEALAEAAGVDDQLHRSAHVWRACCHNVYGVDLVAETAKMARLRLKLRALRSLPSDPPEEDVRTIRNSTVLQHQIKHGNSLIGITNMDELKDALESARDEQQTEQASLAGGAWE